jgi:hypothetical protein
LAFVGLGRTVTNLFTRKITNLRKYDEKVKTCSEAWRRWVKGNFPGPNKSSVAQAKEDDRCQVEGQRLEFIRGTTKGNRGNVPATNAANLERKRRKRNAFVTDHQL